MTIANASRREIAAINVTSLIDVLLVLLITFMLIAPTLSRGLEARVPQPAPDSTPAQPDAIVITVDADRSIRINTEPVAIEALAGRLRNIFSRSPDRVLFVSGSPELQFEDVARVLDVARGAGIAQAALMTQRK